MGRLLGPKGRAIHLVCENPGRMHVHPQQRRSAGRLLRQKHARCPQASMHNPGFDDRKPWAGFAEQVASRRESRHTRSPRRRGGARRHTPGSQKTLGGRYGRSMLSIASVNPPPHAHDSRKAPTRFIAARCMSASPLPPPSTLQPLPRSPTGAQLRWHAAGRRHRPCADGVGIAGAIVLDAYGDVCYEQRKRKRTLHEACRREQQQQLEAAAASTVLPTRTRHRGAQAKLLEKATWPPAGVRFAVGPPPDFARQTCVGANDGAAAHRAVAHLTVKLCAQPASTV